MTQTQLTKQALTTKDARKARKARRQKMPPETMTVAEAAARLGVSEERGYKAVALGQIPTILIGERRVVPIRAFEKMLVDANQPKSGEAA